MNRSFLSSVVMGLVLGAGVSAVYYAPPEHEQRVSVSCSHTLPQPSITAKAGYVYDITSRTALYEKSSEAQLPLASLTKVMTVSTALTILSEDAVVPIVPDALSREGESGLIKNERWTARDLAHVTLIESSNDGAHALGLAAESQLGVPHGGFVDAMNRRARSLGLTQTYFLNDTGLDISTTTAGAYGSARDMAHLVAAIGTEDPELVERSALLSWTTQSASGHTHVAKNTALLAALYPSAVLSKTGFTDLAGGNMVFMFEPLPGYPVALALLGATRESRESDAAILADFATEVVRYRANCRSIW